MAQLPAVGSKQITLGILAHVDAGKTTLSEALLYRTGELRKLGRVDHRDAFLDDNEVERNRGITIFSKQARMRTGDTEIVLIDTPGHVDFAAEMERALSVIDYALLVVSGSEGVQAHTRTLYRMLMQMGIPVFVFINKMDIAVRKREDILSELAEELGANAVDFRGAGVRTEPFTDAVTLHSPELAEKVLEFEFSDAEGASGAAGESAEDGPLSDEDIARAVIRGEIMPCVFGSALKLEGIDELLEVLRRYTLFPEYGDEFGARVYKVTNTEDGERLCFIKVTGGVLRVRDKVSGRSAASHPSGGQEKTAGPDWEDKINQIRLYSGSKFTPAECAGAGEICGVTGLSAAMPGDGIGAEPPSDDQTIIPYMLYSVYGPPDMDPYLVMKDLSTLAEEDPALSVRWVRETGEISIRLMGQVQLEVLAGIVKKRFGYDIGFGTGKVQYLETVAGTYEGVGHFEPLRHYAEVHLIIEPGEPGSGVVITSITPEDELARNWQRLILTHIEEKEHIGVLTGAPLTDVRITLAAGKAHDKHTSGGDFREATYRAVRNALMQARAEDKAVLLEPWNEYEIELPSQNVGRAMMDIKQMGGTQDGLEQNGDMSRLRGRVPAAEIAGYQQVLTGYTAGAGKLGSSPAGYAPCHNTAEVISQCGYDPERDVDNTADSVFVSHGGTDIVKWDEVKDHMHLPSALKRIRSKADGAYRADGSGAAGGRTAGRQRQWGTGELSSREESERRRAAEKELTYIFERTYGSSKDKVRSEARSKSFRRGREIKKELTPEELARNEKRNQEIKAKHGKKTPAPSSKPTLIIVDGYNLIYADSYLTDLSKKDMGAARDQLLDRLSNYAAYVGCDMTVVFDAYLVPYGTGSEEEILGLKIIYTAADEPADIRMGLITDSITDRQMYVVSNDVLVQQDALGHGALRISSREFMSMLSDAEKEIRGLLGDQ